MPRRTVSRLAAALRGLFSLAALLALLGVVPVLLWRTGALPHQVPSWDDVTAALTSPDNGSLFMGALTLIGWAGWLSFACSTIVEITALLRHRRAPRVRALGATQRLAAALVAGVAMLLPAGAAFAAPQAASAAPVSVTAPTTASASQAAAVSVATPDAWSGPVHHVVAGDTLWDLAQDYLGNGARWHEIADLNPQVNKTDLLQPGMVLRLPADAKASHAAQKDHAGQGEHTVTVREGETLSEIAERELGDADAYPQLFEASRTTEQPRGVHLTDADELQPGDVIVIPNPAHTPDQQSATADDASTASPTTGTTPADTPTLSLPTHTVDTPESLWDLAVRRLGDGQRWLDIAALNPALANTPPGQPLPHGTVLRLPADALPAQSTDPQQDTSPIPSASVPAPAAPAPTVPVAPATSTPAPAATTHAPNRQQYPLAPAAAFAGAGALAAAFITTLALRRRLQQRRLRPGRHIPLPTGRAAATEQSLRAAQRPGGFDLLDRALRTLALNLAAEGRELPALDAVVLSESRVDLHLADTAAGLPAAPFTAAADRLWTCPATSTGIADDERLAAADAPYPALVSIGHDTRDRLVLVDLEHIGVLHLAGDQDSARHVLQAVAVEIATSPLPAHLEVEVLDGAVPGLENAVPDRVRRAADPARAVESLLAHATGQHRALAAAGAESLRAARLSEASDSWAPRILLAAGLPEGDDTGRLLTALDQRPRTAAAIVTASAPPVLPAPGCGWTLECPSDGSAVVLPGSGIPVVLQGLADEHLADAVDILVLAASPADAPAPDWITGTPGTDQQPPSVQGPDAADDGLPAEYAELEDELADTEKAPAPRPAEPFQAPVPRPHTPTPPPPASVPAAGPTLADVLAGQDDIPAPATIPAPAAVRRPLPTPAPEKAPDGPSVLVLGPVAIEGAAGQVDSNRRRTATELIAYLALNPGVDHHSLDAALWPGQIVSKQVRNAAISRARSWLGSAPDAALHLPRVQDTDDNRYRLADTVDCDWTRFLHHTRTGLADTGEDGDLALRRALALVRGRPFTGTDPTRYTWAEPAIQTMVSTITHAAHELSTRRLDAHDVPGALWAAKQGLLAGEENETLHRCLFRAHHAAGDTDALRTAAATLSRINNRLGDLDMEGETAALLHELLPRPLATR
ncbi:nucleoid-associated protein YgaU [Kitasatospora sp. MAA19]|uniref:LysM peptidoglycan-binding domain-containing protein n=1 Tax=Kitasatospora sp. MAA19 TaxID=3035090 RepID=UPI002476C1EE|nr:LysM peptidoglycan-binding domain-containing protein [Kitasatospora sp. MAA19]MDH6710906.1 nucleoid-associated protein YgaU [Kitasatospora sp. MAA19]